MDDKTNEHKKLAESLLMEAAEELLINKSCRPTFFILKGNRMVVLPAFFGSLEEKMRYSRLAWALCKKVDADAIFLVTEAWVVIKNVSEVNENTIVPSEDPDREERLMVSYSDKHGVGDLIFSTISRNEEGDPIVSDSEWLSSEATSSRLTPPWDGVDCQYH